jgi:hypothetical protein
MESLTYEIVKNEIGKYSDSKTRVSTKIATLFDQKFDSDKDLIAYPAIREFPYFRVKLNKRNFIMGMIITIISNVMIAIGNFNSGEPMPTYLLITSISNISFNIAIFAWLFDVEAFRVLLVPLYPIYPLLIYIIATRVSPELQLFNYFWHAFHLCFIVQSIVSKKLCNWKFIPVAIVLWIAYMCIITMFFPQMRFILLALDQAILSVVISGLLMMGLLYFIQKAK